MASSGNVTAVHPAALAGPQASPRTGWLFGPGWDLLLGCGGAYVVLLLVRVASGGRVDAWLPLGTVILVASLPHYGATLHRVFATPEDRHRYGFLAGWTTVLVGAAFVGALQSALFGSLLLTLYLTWSPWHYTGQNYGIFLMLLGRRGVKIPARTKRLVYASFVLSFGLTVVAIHSERPDATYAPVSYDGTLFRLLPLGIPAGFATALLAAMGVAYVACLALAVASLARLASWRAVGPSLFLAGTQALWFSIPVAIKGFAGGGTTAAIPGALTSVFSVEGFLWIAAAHAVQYLWITTYFAAARGPVRTRLGFLTWAALAGFAVWTIPALLFAPGLLGRVPYDAGLALMVAAVVNLHHFVLDGAIWKLREGRVARVLLREPEALPAAPAAPTRHRLAMGLLWGVGIASVAVTLLAAAEGQRFQAAVESDRLSEARRSLDRLGWIGRDSAASHVQLGRRFAARGAHAEALAEIERGLALQPSADAWRALAFLHEETGRSQDAAEAYAEVLSLVPDDVSSLYQLGRLQLAEGRLEAARATLEQAAQLAPDNRRVQLSLQRARDAEDTRKGAAAASTATEGVVPSAGAR